MSPIQPTPQKNLGRGQREANNLQTENLGSVPDSLDIEYLFLQRYMTLAETERSLIGHNKPGLIKSCTFRGRDCTDATYFSQNTSANYGNCFTFNSMESSTNYTSSLPGANMGLNIVLNLEQNEYLMNGLTGSAGARLVY